MAKMAEKNKNTTRQKNPPPDESKIEKVTRSYQKGWAYAEVAIQYGIAIVVCTLIGNWLDGKFNTGNLLMISGLILGAVAGFIGLLKQLNVLNFNKKSDSGKKV
jgi:F0F1-type ATP synthase assembly protein I